MPEYKSPQSEPGMEQRFLLVFLVIAALIFGSQFFLKKSAPPQQSNAHPAQQTQPGPTQPAAPPPPPVVTGKPVPASIPTHQQATSESTIVIENSLYRIVFSNRGAQATSWILKNYHDDKGRQLDLVNSAAAAKYGYPLSLWTYDEGLRDKLSTALYVPSETGNLTTPAELTFEYSESGLTVRKT